MALRVVYSVSFWNKPCLPQPLTVTVTYMSTTSHIFSNALVFDSYNYFVKQARLFISFYRSKYICQMSHSQHVVEAELNPRSLEPQFSERGRARVTQDPEHSVVAYFLLLEIGFREEVGSTGSIILSGVWWLSAQQDHATELFTIWTPLFLMRFYLDLLSKSRLHLQLTSPFHCSFPHSVYPGFSVLIVLTKVLIGFASLALPD